MRLSRTTLAVVLGVVLLLAVAARTVKAGTITYNYTGNQMSDITGICPSPCTDTGEFTFSSLLTPNYSGSFIVESPISWSMTDGTVTLSSSASDFLQFNLGSTNGLGEPASWGILACVNSGCPATSNMSTQSDESALANDTTNQQGYSSPYFAATGANDQGSWTVGGLGGTIGSEGPAVYYSFLWGGGAFGASGELGLPPLQQLEDSYFFTMGSTASGCTSQASDILNSVNNFTGSITSSNLAAGTYCIGFDPFTGNIDPTFTLTFSTPVEGVTPLAPETQTPEPSTFVALPAF